MAKRNKQTKTKKRVKLTGIDRVVYLLESILALELNQTNLNRNEIRDRLGIEKSRVNKMLDGIERSSSGSTKAKDRSRKKVRKNKK